MYIDKHRGACSGRKSSRSLQQLIFVPSGNSEKGKEGEDLHCDYI